MPRRANEGDRVRVFPEGTGEREEDPVLGDLLCRSPEGVCTVLLDPGVRIPGSKPDPGRLSGRFGRYYVEVPERRLEFVSS